MVDEQHFSSFAGAAATGAAGAAVAGAVGAAAGAAVETAADIEEKGEVGPPKLTYSETWATDDRTGVATPLSCSWYALLGGAAAGDMMAATDGAANTVATPAPAAAPDSPPPPGDCDDRISLMARAICEI